MEVKHMDKEEGCVSNLSVLPWAYVQPNRPRPSKFVNLGAVVVGQLNMVLRVPQ